MHGRDPSGQAEDIKATIENSRAELVNLCADLVAATSISPPGDTRAVAAVVAERLNAVSVEYRSIAADETKPNLVVSVDGSKPGPHLVFNGHLDTMDPGDASRWTVPIDRLTRRAGRLYGLGMGNMKGGVAALLTSVVVLARHASEFIGRATFTFVSDEVGFGDHGTAYLLRLLPELRGDAVVSAEGSGSMTLAVAEKGVAWIDLAVDGPAGHTSAANRRGTAVAALAEAILRLDDLSDWRPAPPADLEFLGDEQHPGRRVAVNTGTMRAGEARSMMAPTAAAEVDIRLPPGLGLDELDSRVASAVEPLGVRWRRTRGWPASWTSTDAPLTQIVVAAAETIRGQPPELTVRHPASDVMRWRALGTPAVCYGPQPTLSAGIDDYANEQDVMDCAAAYVVAALAFGRTDGTGRSEEAP